MSYILLGSKKTDTRCVSFGLIFILLVFSQSGIRGDTIRGKTLNPWITEKTQSRNVTGDLFLAQYLSPIASLDLFPPDLAMTPTHPDALSGKRLQI